jgi:hypothetical protein
MALFSENIDNSNIHIISDKNEIFNMLFRINSKDLIYDSYNIPISNKYYITIVDAAEGTFGDFFSYIFDQNREAEINFIPEDNIDLNLKWDLEQFYFILLDKKKYLINIENEFNEIKSIIDNSNAETILIIDINYIMNFLLDSKEKKIPVHIFDFLLFQLKKFNLDKIIIFDEENKYSKNNLLYKQIKLCLDKKNINLPIEEYELQVYNYYKDDNLLWKIASSDDKIIIKKKLIIDFDTNIQCYHGLVNDIKAFICKTQISELINNNIFELEINPGIVIDPLDKINFDLTFLNL